MQANPEIERARIAVVSACRRLGTEGLVRGTSGNVSARVGDLVAVTPTGAELVALEGEDVTVVDLAGKVVAGDLAPTSELDLHLGVYERYAAGAVVHTHAPVATALSCVIDELPVVHYEMLMFGGPVRVAGYETFGSRELAAGTLDALDGRTAALMANHGTVVYGHDLAFAVKQALLLEWACGVYWRAASIGTPRVLDGRQRTAVVEAAIAGSYGTTQRIER
jgi:L-fuculose-phosphate aldolase